MTTAKQPYTQPVADLMTMGDVRRKKEWPDYLAMGFSAQHIPELGRMILDRRLFLAKKSSAKVWGPIHAWRTLGQLKDPSAIPALLELLGRVDEYDDDWTGLELPLVFALLGPAAIEPLTTFLADDQQRVYARSTASEALVALAKQYPQQRTACVTAFSQQLQNFAKQASYLNGILINNLVELQGLEAAPLMEEAFAANKVDFMFVGDWEDVQIELGLLEQRLTPPLDLQALMIEHLGLDQATMKKKLEALEDKSLVHTRAQQKVVSKNKAKNKAKRKQAKKSRKKQRKKR